MVSPCKMLDKFSKCRQGLGPETVPRWMGAFRSGRDYKDSGWWSAVGLWIMLLTLSRAVH